MPTQTNILIFFIALSAILFLLWRKSLNRISELKFQKYSLSSKYGKITEQFLPFLDAFPYNPSNFRFLGTPIDGVQFEEDKIIFFEFKSADGRLSPKQTNIRRLIQDKKVTFEEIKLR